MKKIFLSLIIICMANVNTLQADDRQIINVGGYHFPPFVDEKYENATGITIDLIQLLNIYQKQYEFKFILSSSTRRFNHFNEKKYDMIMFESIDWGWKKMDVESSKVYFIGGSKYVTKAEPGKNQSYFDNLNGKSILIILGYHYGFCNYNTDADYLKTHYNATMTSAHEGNILSVIKGRSDMTVVIETYLKKFLHDNPSIKDKILISDKYDLKNYYTILIRKGFKPDTQYMNDLLTRMEKDGTLTKFWAQYGITQ